MWKVCFNWENNVVKWYLLIDLKSYKIIRKQKTRWVTTMCSPLFEWICKGQQNVWEGIYVPKWLETMGDLGYKCWNFSSILQRWNMRPWDQTLTWGGRGSFHMKGMGRLLKVQKRLRTDKEAMKTVCKVGLSRWGVQGKGNQEHLIFELTR